MRGPGAAPATSTHRGQRYLLCARSSLGEMWHLGWPQAL